jgi:hypothetical protein
MRRLSSYDDARSEAWFRVGVCIRALRPHFAGPVGEAWCREAERLSQDLARGGGSRSKAYTSDALADRASILRQALGEAQLEATSNEDAVQLAATAIAARCLSEVEELLREPRAATGSTS